MESSVKDYQVRIDRLKAQLIDSERKKKQMDAELEDKKIEHKRNMKKLLKRKLKNTKKKLPKHKMRHLIK